MPDFAIVGNAVSERLKANERERCAKVVEDMMREQRAEAQVAGDDPERDEEYHLYRAAQKALERAVIAIRGLT